MDLITVRNTLSLSWLRQLRRGTIWSSLVTEILVHGNSAETCRKVTMPWGQVWASKGATITPAVSHFWPFWERFHLHRTREPESPEDVFGTHFWFHPSIYRLYKFSWYAQGWSRIWDGVGCPTPARTLGDLRPIWVGAVTANQRTRQLVDSLFSHLPRAWKTIIGPARSPDSPAPPVSFFDHTVIYNRLGEWIPLESPPT